MFDPSKRTASFETHSAKHICFCRPGSCRAAVVVRRRAIPRAIQRVQPRPRTRRDPTLCIASCFARRRSYTTSDSPRSRVDPAVVRNVPAASSGVGGTVGEAARAGRREARTQ
eukprot:6773943-Prymnesium_polylepis.1